MRYSLQLVPGPRWWFTRRDLAWDYPCVQVQGECLIPYIIIITGIIIIRVTTYDIRHMIYFIRYTTYGQGFGKYPIKKCNVVLTV